MRFFLISALFVVLISSCAAPTVKGLPEIETAATEFINPYFSNIDQDYVYKAKINAYGSTLGGVLIIKKLNLSTHRFVFVTTFGNKIFDLEISDYSIKTHYIIDELDRGLVLKMLHRDFEILTKEHIKITKSFKRANEDIIHQSKTKKGNNHYITTLQSQELLEIIHSKNSKEKIIFTFSKVKNSIAEKISIDHKTAPLKIDLEYISKN
tara:strand:+ start:31314 stop:31940 length:627 start_codon:yes stop_codon:yes gene_type:complete